MKQDLDEAIRLVKETETRGRSVVVPTVWMPGNATLMDVFSGTGCLGCVYSWSPPEKAGVGFTMQVQLKVGYVRDFCEALLALGGHVKKTEDE